MARAAGAALKVWLLGGLLALGFGLCGFGRGRGLQPLPGLQPGLQGVLAARVLRLPLGYGAQNLGQVFLPGLHGLLRACGKAGLRFQKSLHGGLAVAEAALPFLPKLAVRLP